MAAEKKQSQSEKLAEDFVKFTNLLWARVDMLGEYCRDLTIREDRAQFYRVLSECLLNYLRNISITPGISSKDITDNDISLREPFSFSTASVILRYGPGNIRLRRRSWPREKTISKNDAEVVLSPSDFLADDWEIEKEAPGLL